MEANGTTVRSLPREFRSVIPYIPAIDNFVARSNGLLTYDRGLGQLVIHGALTQDLFRELLVAYHAQPNAVQIHSVLRAASDTSQFFVSDEELDKLETFARRIRGEIFFARRWLLVEGQSDYHIMHGVANGLGYNLDENGVSVIDFQNCGNPECFAVLARALGYPWLMLVDGDTAGTKYLADVQARGFSNAEMAQRGFQLPVGDMEAELVASGLQVELKAVLGEIGITAGGFNDAELADAMRGHKSAYAALLGRRCATDASLSQRMPEIIRRAIGGLRGLA